MTIFLNYRRETEQAYPYLNATYLKVCWRASVTTQWQRGVVLASPERDVLLHVPASSMAEVAEDTNAVEREHPGDSDSLARDSEQWALKRCPAMGAVRRNVAAGAGPASSAKGDGEGFGAWYHPVLPRGRPSRRPGRRKARR